MKNRKILLIILVFLVLGTILTIVWQNSPTPPQSDALRVAVLVPLTGPAASGGIATREGFELALDDIRKSGHELEVEYIDTKSEPKTALSAFEQTLAVSKPHAVILELSSVTRAIRPTLNGRVFALATAVAVPDIADPSLNIVRVFPSSSGVAAEAARAASERGIKKCAVVHVNDDYGSESGKIFGEAFSAAGGTIVATESFDLLARDFRAQLTKILASNPPAIWVTGYGPGYLTVLNQVKEAGFQGTILTDWSITAPDYFSAVRDKDGILVVAPVVSDTLGKAYRDRFAKEGFMVNVAFAYDSLQLLDKAFRESDGKPDGMTSAFLAIKEFDGAAGTIRIRADGDIDVPYTVFEIRGTKLQKSGS